MTEREWLREPVGPNEVRIHVDLGDGTEVSPDLRDALDAFVRELHASEVEGFVSMVPRPVRVHEVLVSTRDVPAAASIPIRCKVADFI